MRITAVSSYNNKHFKNNSEREKAFYVHGFSNDKFTFSGYRIKTPLADLPDFKKAIDEKLTGLYHKITDKYDFQEIIVEGKRLKRIIFEKESGNTSYLNYNNAGDISRIRAFDKDKKTIMQASYFYNSPGSLSERLVHYKKDEVVNNRKYKNELVNTKNKLRPILTEETEYLPDESIFSIISDKGETAVRGEIDGLSVEERYNAKGLLLHNVYSYEGKTLENNFVKGKLSHGVFTDSDKEVYTVGYHDDDINKVTDKFGLSVDDEFIFNWIESFKTQENYVYEGFKHPVMQQRFKKIQRINKSKQKAFWQVPFQDLFKNTECLREMLAN